MEKTEKKIIRDSNIELLRIFSILGVIVLHYNSTDIGSGFTYVTHGSLNFYLLNIFQALFICAVNIFILITGYYSCSSCKRTVVKPIELLFQVIIFRVVICVPSWVANCSFSKKQFLNALLPVNYFVILYITLYFISPYINIVLHHLSNKALSYMVAIMFFFLSIWPTMVDILQEIANAEFMGLSTISIIGSINGYSIVNFVLMYIIGGFIRIKKIEIKDIKIILIAFLINLSFVVFLSLWSASIAWSYCNPLVVLESVIIFLLFKEMKIKSRIINSLSKASFTVFLLHTVFFNWINVKNYVNRNSVIMLLHLIITSIIIYMICYVIWVIYDIMTKKLFSMLLNKIGYYSVDMEVEDENTVCKF